jgi:hypothetical protein
MRGRFGGYFFGQVATFVYLTEAMRTAPQFQIETWPQFSLYNLLVANFWPLYWVAHLVDAAKVDEAYWHVYAVAESRAGEVIHLVQLLTASSAA